MTRLSRKQATKITSYTLGLAGLVLIGYMLKVLGDNGLYADAHHTGAYAWYTPIEWGLVLFGAVLVVLSIILLLKSAGNVK